MNSNIHDTSTINNTTTTSIAVTSNNDKQQRQGLTTTTTKLAATGILPKELANDVILAQQWLWIPS
jgi:hypothetical protein